MFSHIPDADNSPPDPVHGVSVIEVGPAQNVATSPPLPAIARTASPDNVEKAEMALSNARTTRMVKTEFR